MDLSKFDGMAERFDEGRRIHILHPETGKKTDLWLQIVSYQSDRCKKAQRRLANRALRDAKRNPRKSMTAEELEDHSIVYAASAVVDWNAERHGKPLECTTENVRDTLSDPNHWFIVQQIDQEADDEQSFLSKSPIASVSRSKSKSATT